VRTVCGMWGRAWDSCTPLCGVVEPPHTIFCRRAAIKPLRVNLPDSFSFHGYTSVGYWHASGWCDGREHNFFLVDSQVQNIIKQLALPAMLAWMVASKFTLAEAFQFKIVHCTTKWIKNWFKPGVQMPRPQSLNQSTIYFAAPITMPKFESDGCIQYTLGCKHLSQLFWQCGVLKQVSKPKSTTLPLPYAA
jgi:hypothetical protein